jgi:hypothetical protein
MYLLTRTSAGILTNGAKQVIYSTWRTKERDLMKILNNYDIVVVVAGEHYRSVLKNIWDDRFVYLKSAGIGSLCSIIGHAIPDVNNKLDEFV